MGLSSPHSVSKSVCTAGAVARFMAVWAESDCDHYWRRTADLTNTGAMAAFQAGAMTASMTDMKAQSHRSVMNSKTSALGQKEPLPTNGA